MFKLLFSCNSIIYALFFGKKCSIFILLRTVFVLVFKVDKLAKKREKLRVSQIWKEC
jgi:hypothetical protein